MKISILYATYSNSTYTAAEVLSEALQEAGYKVEVSLVSMANAQTLADADITIFASPSWDYDGKEGQPHEDFFHFFSQISAGSIAPFSYSIMALGDSNYTYFCGAAEELETLANAIGGTQLYKALKLDQYYLNETLCVESIKTWAKQLAETIT